MKRLLALLAAILMTVATPTSAQADDIVGYYRNPTASPGALAVVDTPAGIRAVFSDWQKSPSVTSVWNGNTWVPWAGVHVSWHDSVNGRYCAVSEPQPQLPAGNSFTLGCRNARGIWRNIQPPAGLVIDEFSRFALSDTALDAVLRTPAGGNEWWTYNGGWHQVSILLPAGSGQVTLDSSGSVACVAWAEPRTQEIIVGCDWHTVRVIGFAPVFTVIPVPNIGEVLQTLMTLDYAAVRWSVLGAYDGRAVVFPNARYAAGPPPGPFYLASDTAVLYTDIAAGTALHAWSLTSNQRVFAWGLPFRREMDVYDNKLLGVDQDYITGALTAPYVIYP